MNVKMESLATKPNVIKEFNNELNKIFLREKANNPRGYLDAFESRFEIHCDTAAAELGLSAIVTERVCDQTFVPVTTVMVYEDTGMARAVLKENGWPI